MLITFSHSLSIGKPQLPSGMRGLAPRAGALSQPRERGSSGAAVSARGRPPSITGTVWMEGWESRRAPLSELGQLGAWGGSKGARKERACWEDGDRLCSCRGRTSASKQLCVPEAAGPWERGEQLQIQQQVAARASLRHCLQRSGVALAASESVAQRQGGSLGHGGSCSAGNDLWRMSLLADCVA